MPILLLPMLWFVAELVLLVLVAGKIGALATLGWLAFAVVLGVLLIRGQKISMLGSIARGMRPQPGDLREGSFRVLAGLLLIVPGFLSDALAVVFLLPPLRIGLGALLLKWLPVERFTVYRSRQVYEHEATPVREESEESAPRVIEGEVVQRKPEE
ncbi:MAG: FxsA family protein [Cardiobacteriaceae bacterium]|nr:FxsA family protein [Cardiobacteriaceae bacterium]